MSPPDTFGRPRSVAAPRWIKPVCIGGVALLTAIALGIVLFLPDAVRETPQVPATSANKGAPPAAPEPGARDEPTGAAPPAVDDRIDRPASAPSPPLSPAPAPATVPPPEKAAADLARSDALRLQAGLENAGVRDWARTRFETSYPDAVSVLDRANAEYERGGFGAAKGLYGEAAALLRTLEKNRPARLQRALEAGEAAMRAFDPDTAAARFGEALTLESGNETAAAGLRRAANLRRAIGLSKEGEEHLAAGRLGEAVSAFAEAVSADPAYSPASRALRSTRDEIARQRFVARMSAAVQAMESGRLEDARRALDEAAGLRPADPSVRDLRQRLDVAVRNAELRKLRAETARLEEAEDWLQAVTAYERALGIDATSAFVVEGLARARRFAELHRQMDFYLDQPDRLQSDEPRTHAQSVLAAARGVRNAGDRLTEKRERLGDLLAAAQVPVAVTLVSDGKTSVTLYRVARMGTFTERRLELMPGSYTAVGARAGYRDVRVTFRVPLRSTGVTVTVRCEEPI